MNSRTTLLALVLCATLFGCAVQSLKTSGDVVSERRVATVKVIIDPTLPSQISITRHRSGTVTEADKITAKTNANKLVHLFSNGFTTKFPVLASGYGLATANPPDNAALMKISVMSLMMDCSGFGCQSTLVVKGELLSASATPFWQFSSRVGQKIVNSPISDELFDTFATALLEAMKKDNVIARNQ